MDRCRISSSWLRAAICWANNVAWMPWKSPSSHPTSCAWAIRSSASLGMSDSNGRASRSSSAVKSGDSAHGRLVDVLQAHTAGRVERRLPHLVEKLLDHRPDPQDLGGLLDGVDDFDSFDADILGKRTPTVAGRRLRRQDVAQACAKRRMSSTESSAVCSPSHCSQPSTCRHERMRRVPASFNTTTNASESSTNSSRTYGRQSVAARAGSTSRPFRMRRKRWDGAVT